MTATISTGSERLYRRGRKLVKTGLSRTPEYKAWKDMRLRCSNPKHKDYPNYGGRGIKVCERWQNSVQAFVADMGPRPSKDHSLDRKENSGNYEPDNCRWATKLEQSRNRRNVWSRAEKQELKQLIADGKTHKEVAKLIGRTPACVSTAANRLGVDAAKRYEPAWRDAAYERELLQAFEAMERAKGYL